MQITTTNSTKTDALIKLKCNVLTVEEESVDNKVL